MGNLFFTPEFRWGRFLLSALPLAFGVLFLGRWAVYDFLHGAITATFLIKVLLDAGVLTRKKKRGEAKVRRLEPSEQQQQLP